MALFESHPCSSPLDLPSFSPTVVLNKEYSMNCMNSCSQVDNFCFFSSIDISHRVLCFMKSQSSQERVRQTETLRIGIASNKCVSSFCLLSLSPAGAVRESVRCDDACYWPIADRLEKKEKGRDFPFSVIPFCSLVCVLSGQ